jgi:hypothetical protein
MRLIPTCFAMSVFALLAAAQPAAARIECNGNFQMNPSGPIATPYCEEEQIARVAQSYGWKVTADQGLCLPKPRL